MSFDWRQIGREAHLAQLLLDFSDVIYEALDAYIERPRTADKSAAAQALREAMQKEGLER